MEQRVRRQSTAPKLKKQPKLKRVNAMSAAAYPRLTIPKPTAQEARRRRRNQRRIKLTFPTQLLKRFVTSARWVSLGLLVVVVYALITVGSNQNFYLTHIPVDGVYSIAAEEIVAASGLAGQHIFAADPAQAAAAIAETPGVIAAAVEVEWPNTVRISITEDAPIAIWEDPDGTFWVNSAGNLIPARLDVPGLYRIHSSSIAPVLGRQYASEMTTEPEAAAVVTAEEEQTAEAAATAIAADTPAVAVLGSIPMPILDGALQLNKLLPERSEIIYDTRHGLTYQDSRGWNVYLGTGTDMEQKLAVYEALVTELQAQGLTPEYISVSNQEKPFFFAYESPEE